MLSRSGTDCGVFFLQQLPKNVSFQHSLVLVQEHAVANLKPAVVKLYDYYQPSKLYTLLQSSTETTLNKMNIYQNSNSNEPIGYGLTILAASGVASSLLLTIVYGPIRNLRNNNLNGIKI